MKRLAAILCLSAVTTGAFAQGLVTFNNNPATLISQQVSGGGSAAISGAAGSYYFGLLTAAAGTVDPKAFTFAGIYATNSGAAAGRFIGGSGVTVATWAPGQTLAYEVAGWSSSLGATFNAAWLTSNPGGFGLSSIGSGAAGGGVPPAPAFPLFGGTGIGSGFGISPVPEPTSMALAGLGAAALLIFRRRK